MYDPIQPISLENWRDIFGATWEGAIYPTEELLTQVDSPLSFSMILGLLEETHFLHSRHLSTTLEVVDRTPTKIEVHILQWYKDRREDIPKRVYTYRLSPTGTWLSASLFPQQEIQAPFKSKERYLALLLCCRLLERHGEALGNTVGILTMDSIEEGNVDRGYVTTIFPVSSGGYTIHYRLQASPDLRYLMWFPEW
jgi:hypothetical protein